MKLFWFVFFTGFIIFYFAVQAVGIPFLSVEMIFNDIYHFLAGFIFLIGVITLEVEHKFRTLLMFVAGVLVLDGIYGYYQNGIDRNYIVTHLYNLYLLFWGAVSGLMFKKSRK